ncbi:hypothetical protein K2X30_05985 [bacterium]|jgi:predicted amino acid dehydrogenase|nr:hypothetical protein [bacterium]
MIPSSRRKILVINFLKEGPVDSEVTVFSGAEFEIVQHKIGWNFAAAEELIKRFDGYVDGISLCGLQKKASVGRHQFMHPGYLAMMKVATKTPLYLADDVRDFFADWTIQRVLKEQPQFFAGKKVLFQVGIVSSILSRVEQAGGQLYGADPLVISGIPLLLKGRLAFQTFLRTLGTSHGILSKLGIDPGRSMKNQRVLKQLDKWVRDADIFVAFNNMLDRMASLECLRGKILLVDYLNADTRARLDELDLAQIVEFTPDHPMLNPIRSRHFSVLSALIDQKRMQDDSPCGFDEYLLKWTQEQNISPKKLSSSRGVVRRCAFIVHPLSLQQLCEGSKVPFLPVAPKTVQKTAADVMGRLPIFKFGTLKGAVSEANGQEVVCDIYAMAATPAGLMGMDEQYVYKRLVDGAELAKKNGAAILGLGAYTKVVGDSGVTVARKAPIPVTTGNSYSSSSTLWAAREMVERLGIYSRPENGMIRKAMVIGATGSIGRVSSILVSLVANEIVLVAVRPDKLLELRQEILEMSPSTKVKVTTQPTAEDLADTDLIVTATSNRDGSVLNMDLVKPGAVVCDCSRPLDIGAEEAAKRPDVLVIESGEILLPGNLTIDCDIGLPKPVVYACLAETVLLTMEGRYESYSLSKQLSMEKVKEIYKIGIKHGAKLASICGPTGVITDEQIQRCRELARERLKTWNGGGRQKNYDESVLSRPELHISQ